MKDKIIEILKGIDKNECESPDGWWETSVGAEFGERKLKELLEYIESNTLNGDKVMKIVRGKCISDLAAEAAVNEICSLSLPTLSEEEIDDLLYPICDDLEKNYIGAWTGVEQIKAALEELNKPKEE